MRNLIIIFASFALVLACQSNDGPSTPEPAPEPAADETIIEKASALRPVAAVTSKNVGTDMNFSKEMEGAKPGEIRGFVDPDGDKAYAMLSNGKMTFQQFAVYVFNKQEKLNLDPSQLRQAAIALAQQNGVGSDPDKPMEANEQVVCQLKFFAKLVKSNTAAIDTLKDSPTMTGGDAGLSAGSKKALGYTAPKTGGLDID